MTRSAESKEAWELDFDEEADPKMPWAMALLATWLTFAVLMSFVPLGAWMHWTHLSWGPRAFLAHGVLKTAVFFLVYWVLFHCVLIWPLTSGVYTQFGPRMGRLGRVILATAMTSIPLLSLAYYLGHYREALHFHEAMLAVIPCVLLGALIFEVTQRPLCFSFLTALSTFACFLVWGDILGPFTPVWTYTAHGPGIYGLRLITIGAAVLTAVALLKKRPVTTEMHFTHAKIILVLLMTHFFFVAFGAPWINHRIQPSMPLEFLTRDISWLGYIAGLYFLWRRNLFSLRALQALALCEVGSLMLQIAFFADRREASFLGLSRCLHWVMALLFFSWLWTFLRRQNSQATFLRTEAVV